MVTLGGAEAAQPRMAQLTSCSLEESGSPGEGNWGHTSTPDGGCGGNGTALCPEGQDPPRARVRPALRV